MSKFGWESDEKLRKGTEPSPPRTARDLIQLLGVSGSDREVQAEAVADWLDTHEPDDLLRVSLKHHGLPHPSQVTYGSPGMLVIDLHHRVIAQDVRVTVGPPHALGRVFGGKTWVARGSRQKLRDWGRKTEAAWKDPVA